MQSADFGVIQDTAGDDILPGFDEFRGIQLHLHPGLMRSVRGALGNVRSDRPKIVGTHLPLWDITGRPHFYTHRSSI
jgi:hypothetical protein